jgi:hypothetical protein
MESIKELEDKQREERDLFIAKCSHTKVKVIDRDTGFRHREINLICERCGLNLLGYTIDGDWSYMSYVRDCVNGHPSHRKEATNE